MMIADYISAMEKKDYVALSECFAENCRLFDYCPAGIGQENFYIYVKQAVDMFYHNKFILGGFSVVDPIIVDERTVNFYATYGGVVMHVVAAIETYDAKTGKIRELVIRPA